MTVLPTAKILLFIALNVGPHHASNVFATSLSENYTYAATPTGWTITGLGFPASDCTRDPSASVAIDGTPGPSSVPRFLRAICRHDWSRNTAMVFDNGDRVEKNGDHAFYIINAGAANEKVFTIFFPDEK
jgi:hypothetical protein